MLVIIKIKWRLKKLMRFTRYSMLNGVIDSREVRAQKAALSSHSSGTSSVRRRSEDELEIIRLKEAMRQRDEYFAACFAQQQAMLQVS
jgi:predicted oxidoreductase (fatty acid repression mutant protein)